MAELRRSLYALVERPPVRPVAVEVVAARGAQFRRRRRVLRSAFGVALIAAVIGVSVAGRDSESGLDLATGGPTSAGYIAERPGGYVAAGDWRLTIFRDGQVIELSSTTSDHCGRTGVIIPGDEVRGSITGPGSTLRVGERFTCPD